MEREKNNYFAVFDAVVWAPNGWEIPSKADWLELANSFEA